MRIQFFIFELFAKQNFSQSFENFPYTYSHYFAKILCILENVDSFLDIPNKTGDLTVSAAVLLEVTKLAFKRRVIQACNLIVAHVNLTNGLAWFG